MPVNYISRVVFHYKIFSMPLLYWNEIIIIFISPLFKVPLFTHVILVPVCISVEIIFSGMAVSHATHRVALIKSVRITLEAVEMEDHISQDIKIGENTH